MKQVFKSNKGIITENVPIPMPGENEVLVQVNYSLISTGTETSSMRKKEKTIIEKINEKKELIEKISTKLSSDGIKPTWNKIKNKLNPSEESIVLNPIGYSNAGIIIAKGSNVTKFNIGDKVACAGSGIAAHAEYVTIPINLVVKVPESLPLKQAAFTTVGSIALQGIRRANVTFGDTVVIVGLGLLGLLAVQIAKAWGLLVIGIDLEKERIDTAISLGTDICFLGNDKNLSDKIFQFTRGYGADAVLIYASTKSSEPANQAFTYCRQKGRVVVVGNIGMDINRENMYKKELDLVMSTSYGPGRYDPLYEIKGIDYPIGYVRWTENRNMQEFIRLLNKHSVNVELLVNNTFSIDESAKAYHYLVEDKNKPVSILFYYNNEINKLNNLNFKINYSNELTTINNGKINVAIIGAGGFANRVHIPNLVKLASDYHISAIVDNNPAKAKMALNKYKPDYITSDYTDVLKDKNIDMVIITTRHNMHAKLVVESLNSGKHVLVEKPLAMNQLELDEIKKTLEKTDRFLIVGFNRRYSPLTIKAKEIIKKTNDPIFVNYRINAGYVPVDSWIQSPNEGGGRIIGECCHFLDYANFLTESDIEDIKISWIPIDNKLIQIEDNLIITISYVNGSLATISYVSIGGKELAKERIEIFAAKSSMVIDDFNSLKMYNTEHSNIKLKETDKGHLRELEEVGKLIKGKKSLIFPLKYDILATEETLYIMETIHGKNN